MALAHLDAPVEIGGGIGAEVKGATEGNGEALVEALLVEIKGGFEGGRLAR